MSTIDNQIRQKMRQRQCEQSKNYILRNYQSQYVELIHLALFISMYQLRGKLFLNYEQLSISINNESLLAMNFHMFINLGNFDCGFFDVEDFNRAGFEFGDSDAG